MHVTFGDKHAIQIVDTHSCQYGRCRRACKRFLQVGAIPRRRLSTAMGRNRSNPTAQRSAM